MIDGLIGITGVRINGIRVFGDGNSPKAIFLLAVKTSSGDEEIEFETEQKFVESVNENLGKGMEVEEAVKIFCQNYLDFVSLVAVKIVDVRRMK